MTSEERWPGKIGFVLAAIGSAIGLGSIWKFPSTVCKRRKRHCSGSKHRAPPKVSKSYHPSMGARRRWRSCPAWRLFPLGNHKGDQEPEPPDQESGGDIGRVVH